MAQTDTQQIQISDSAQFAGRWAGRLAAIVTAILLLLSLLSYDADDLQILSGGVGSADLVNNWIGRFGAYLSGILVDWLGLGVYPAIILIIACLMSRVFGQPSRKLSVLYFLGLAVACLGMSFALGCFPGFAPDLCRSMNLYMTPGGAIGQRFCSPGTFAGDTGWLSYVVNPIGSMIIAIAMIVLGMVTIWFFDWQNATRTWWAMGLERLALKREEFARLREEKLAERERERLATREVRAAVKQAEKEAKEAVREAVKVAAEAVTEKARSQKTRPKPVSPAKQPELPKSAGEFADSSSADLPVQKKKLVDYRLPTIDLLEAFGSSVNVDPKEIAQKRVALQETLESFGIDAQVGDITSGPRVTLFEVKPGPGVKVERITGLANNLAMSLRAESLRIQAPIPGRDSIGIEVPNATAAVVSFRELLESKTWRDTKAMIPIGLGKNINGNHVVMDLARCPHLLIAGATGAGKSVCMNTLILSLLYRFSPEELKMIMVDPKVVEFSGYNTLPHLVTPVVTDVKKVPIALRWAVNQMEWRYQILAKAGVRNIADFNTRKYDPEVKDGDGNALPERLPYIVVIIDELADIMMTARGDVETSLARIAQLARAVGIHAVIATQRPSVDVLTGIIKANFPTRIAFQVSSLTDSRTILDGKGAEALLGRGDMLFKGTGSKLERTQGAMVDDHEIRAVVDWVSEQAAPDFSYDIFTASGASGDDGGDGGGKGGNLPKAPSMPGPTLAAAKREADQEAEDGSDEGLFKQAIEVILRDRRATTSHIQRRLRIGYNRAALVIEELERRGIIGPQIGTAPREILIVDEGDMGGGTANGTDGDDAADDDPLETS